ncbi:MAG TPA: hypothetical protein VMR74_07450 [Gammaproteobacteria bacterium]|nr:hypothetical protein [Gammaproteobacteria bacterium]
MRISDPTPAGPFALAAAALLSLGLAGTASANAADEGNYDWSAKLVSYDEATNTAVVQARVESYVEIEGLDEFSEGDRLVLSWTGRSWAAGIRGLARDPELTPSTLSLPVEFVSTELDGRYIDFRIPVPESASEIIADMEAGTRVTGTSPRRATDWATSVISLRHYNDVG